jgi:predicted nucleic acid-binding protein
VTLCDAGPLFALLDPRQAHLHVRCKSVLAELTSPLITTWPSFTEAMYLAHRSGGWPMQQLLWRYVGDKALVLHECGTSEAERMASLMEQYRDTPMDLADASLVVAAESLGVSRIFTLDHHFRIYRIDDSQCLRSLPLKRGSLRSFPGFNVHTLRLRSPSIPFWGIRRRLRGQS